MLYVLRHGQTAGNRQRRYIGGRTDEPLCPEGRAEVQGLGPFNNVLRVYVSPMLRARQTAGLLFPCARQVVCEPLREMDFGLFENRSPSEMEEDAAYRSWVGSNCQDPCPGGESIFTFGERVAAEVERIVRQDWGSDVVVVAHGGVIMAVMRLFAKSWRADMDWLVPNCRGWAAQPELVAGRLMLSAERYLAKLDFSGARTAAP